MTARLELWAVLLNTPLHHLVDLVIVRTNIISHPSRDLRSRLSFRKLDATKPRFEPDGLFGSSSLICYFACRQALAREALQFVDCLSRPRCAMIAFHSLTPALRWNTST
ncbi:hypothetical protein [Sphingomonas daechungensis]|uniref:hypothetical protein n=1 Tax=Sphingomonas daechungensis TaxID=1176646 RepID=UPI0031EA300B